MMGKSWMANSVCKHPPYIAKENMDASLLPGVCVLLDISVRSLCSGDTPGSRQKRRDYGTATLPLDEWLPSLAFCAELCPKGQVQHPEALKLKLYMSPKVPDESTSLLTVMCTWCCWSYWTEQQTSNLSCYSLRNACPCGDPQPMDQLPHYYS